MHPVLSGKGPPHCKGRTNPGFLVSSLVIFFIAVLSPSARAADVVHGRVEYILDGDSLTVEADDHQLEVRLWGIDSPEYNQSGAWQAREALSRLALGREVNLRIKYRDRYGRTVAEIYHKGTSINELMVAEGHSWVHPYYCRKPVCKRWKRLETEARQRRIGVWSSDNPVPPWQWKKRG